MGGPQGFLKAPSHGSHTLLTKLKPVAPLTIQVEILGQGLPQGEQWWAGRTQSPSRWPEMGSRWEGPSAGGSSSPAPAPPEGSPWNLPFTRKQWSQTTGCGFQLCRSATTNEGEGTLGAPVSPAVTRGQQNAQHGAQGHAWDGISVPKVAAILWPQQRRGEPAHPGLSVPPQGLLPLLFSLPSPCSHPRSSSLPSGAQGA